MVHIKISLKKKNKQKKHLTSSQTKGPSMVLTHRKHVLMLAVITMTKIATERTNPC